MKACRDCNRVLPLDEFYVHVQMKDGHLNKCKACVKARVRKHSAMNPEQRREYERKRYQRPIRKAQMREWSRASRERDPERARARARAYAKRHPERRRESTRASRERHPERTAARTAVGNAIRDGRLVREPCMDCGATKEVHAHHEDYSRPLHILWLCRPCHAQWHALFEARGPF